MTKILERNYEIRSNMVFEVKKVRTDIGIISEGLDREDCKIIINNLDAGKSKELMRVALEGKPKKISLGIITILLGTVGTAIFFIFAYWGYMRFSGPPEVPKVENVFNTEIQTSEPIPLVSSGTGEEIIQEEQINIAQERRNMQNDFALESIKLEIQKKDIIISSLEIEKKQILEQNILLSGENKALLDTIASYEEKKTTREGVLLQIGEFVDERCRINNSPECKEIYFNILKK